MTCLFFTELLVGYYSLGGSHAIPVETLGTREWTNNKNYLTIPTTTPQTSQDRIEFAVETEFCFQWDLKSEHWAKEASSVQVFAEMKFN